MATTTMKRQQQQKTTGQWSTIFPNEQSTQQQSALFVKKLLAVAISNVTYLRTIFPEHAFGDRCLEDLSLKILRDDSSCPGACQVIQWVKGCFDALDKKYLRMIVIGLYEDANDMDNVVETYSFKFEYNDNQSLKIFRNDAEVASAFSSADTKRATIKLLRTIVVLTQTLKPLPDDALMTMKLFYYDDVTPSDYEPEGFKATSSDEDFKFRDESVSIKVGDVATAFHAVKLRIRTSNSQFEMVEDSQSQQNTTVSPKPVNSDTTVNGAVCGKAAEPSRKDQAGMDESVDEANSSPEEDNDNVRCPCGVNENDGLMMWCDGCEVWQHALCYGFLADSKLPDTHFCEQCYLNKDRQCTDPYLSSLDPVSLQATCLWRRALVASAEFTKLVPSRFSVRLGVEVPVAQGLINRLEKEGFIKALSKGKRLGKVVDKDRVKNEGVLKYFDKEAAKKKKPLRASARMSTGGRSPRIQLNGRNEPSPTQQSMEEVTQQTSALGISSRRKPVKPVIPEHILEEGVRRSPRLRKRARSTVDEDIEFDLSMSQEQGSRANKKRKASIASKSILV